jgi:LPXTG-site transpeptidase (sortase) family protein
MDDNLYRIPSQPNQPQNQDDSQRQDGADSAADIARSKLRAIYEQQNDSEPQTQQAQPAQPQTPVQQPDPAYRQSNPANYHSQTVQPEQQPAPPNNSHPESVVTPGPTQHQAQHRQRPIEQASESATSQPQQSQVFHPQTEPNQFHAQPTNVTPAAEPTQRDQNHPTAEPHIIQPTPAQPESQQGDPLDFHIPGQPQSSPQFSQQGYVPSQQYAQEVSLEDQIDGLKHTAPDHQLPIQSQSSARKSWIPSSLQPLLRSLALAVVIAIIYNHQFLVGQVQSYINPAQSVVSPAIIAPNQSENVSDENKIVIPKINVDIPVVYDVTTFEESAVQAGLERGVVHYGNTALPGENGNNVILGHSSNNFWNNGKYKFAFVLLNKLQEGDTFTLHYEGTAYTYEVFQRRIVPPTAVEVIFEDFGEPVVTLITCDPPGTAWNRLVVNARQISPDPDNATTPKDSPDQPNEVITVPSDSSSLLDNLFN